MEMAIPFIRKTNDTFNEIECVLRKHFENPDVEAAKIILACVAAHRIEDRPPVWVLAIAPPGSMKTAILESLHGLPSIPFVDEVTDKTFISGKVDEPGKTRKTPASYLHRIGREGILVSADFGTILCTDKRVRNTVLAQLRRIFDGRFTRQFGTDENTEERTWEGRLTLLAGGTPGVDSYHNVFQSLSERFVRVRWPRAGGIDAGRRALRQEETVVKVDLMMAVHDFLLRVLRREAIEPPLIDPQWEQRIATLSEVVALARADVPRVRDGKREICESPPPEGNTRLAQELAQVGWAVLNGRTEVGEEEFALIVRAGLDSIPPIRKQVLMALLKGTSAYTLGLPESSVNRALEDLQAIGLATKKGDRDWQLSETARALLEDCFPQTVQGESAA
jgi:hypothetical protein